MTESPFIEMPVVVPPSGPFLRFADEATWVSAATEAGLYSEPDEDGNSTLLAYTHDHAIDVVGTITRGGEYDPETGEVVVAPTVLDGWHVNFAGTLPDGWEEFVVTPAAPYRVFA
jgi:predicted NUDIX family NTP pyrophosphohydrolase